MTGIQLSLRYISIKTNHFDEMLHFYTEVIGLHPLSFENDAVFLGDKSKQEPLFVLVDEAATNETQASLKHIAFQLPNKESLNTLVHHLDDHNIPHTKVTEKGNFTHFFVTDPDGHELECYYNGAETLQQVIVADEVEFHDETLDTVEYAPTQSLGHIHLSVADLEEALMIHKDIFGLQPIKDRQLYHLVDETDNLMMTLEDSDEHPSSSIEFIAFQVQSMDELLRIKDRLEENDYKYYFNKGKRVLQFTDRNHLSYWIYAG